LSSSGSGAVEMALKFLRQYAVSTGQGSRDVVLSLLPSYHGATLQTIAIGGDVATPPTYAPMVTFSEKVPAPLTYRAPSPEAAAQASIAALESAILRLGRDRVLAFVVEPIGGQVRRVPRLR
jgi:adenosylmethionine-8-amino-7-oxononanoate aminotransferase